MVSPVDNVSTSTCEHVVRAGPFQTTRKFWLNGEFLCWNQPQQDESSGIALSDLVSMRMHSQGAGLEGKAYCDLIERSGRRHRISDLHWFDTLERKQGAKGRKERRCDSYMRLTATLARRLRLANPDAQFLTGPSKIEWTATLVVAVLSVLIILYGLYLMTVQQRYPFHIIGFMVMALVYLPLLWPVIRSGGPKPFDPMSLKIPGEAFG